MKFIVIFLLIFITADYSYGSTVNNSEIQSEIRIPKQYVRDEVSNPEDYERVKFIKVENKPHILESITDNFAEFIMFSFVFISFAVGLVIGLAGLVIGSVIMIPIAIYYESKEVIINSATDKLVEVKLCPAAQELYIDFDKVSKPEGWSLNVISMKRDEAFSQIDKLEEVKLDSPRINTYEQSIAPKRKYSHVFNPPMGIWYPFRAYTYKDESYIQLINYFGSQYQTATAKFSDIILLLNFNNKETFTVMDKKMNIRHLCTRLKQLSVHKLKENKG